jgi:hypothetical protein
VGDRAARRHPPRLLGVRALFAAWLLKRAVQA